MRMPETHHATDCNTRPKDWAALGTRVLRAAAIASAIHQASGPVEVANESTVPAEDRNVKVD